MSVGSVAVRLKYGLYVGHLSKLAFHFMFIVVCLVVGVSSVRLACNVFRLSEVFYFGAFVAQSLCQKYCNKDK